MSSMRKQCGVGSGNEGSHASTTEPRARTAVCSAPGFFIVMVSIYPNENHGNFRKFPSKKMDDLAAKASLWGVEPGYHDVFGRWHEPSVEAQRGLVAALSHGRARPPGLRPVGTPARPFH